MIDNYKIYENFSIVIIARLKSRRLKEKALIPIYKKNNSLDLIIKKLKKNNLKNIILATSKHSQDNKIIKHVKKYNILTYRGYSMDVLKRVYYASNLLNFNNIFIITADNPLFDINLMRNMSRIHLTKNLDFTEAINVPYGAYGWFLKKTSLYKIIKKKKEKDTEIWGKFFRNKKNIKHYKFKYLSKLNYYKIKHLRLTLDEKDDLKFIRNILQISKNIFISLNEIKSLIKKKISLLSINSHVQQK
jgi:spore coat polysaccharide biosynthesis protein SpsF (cytidylyltransferase family)